MNNNPIYSRRSIRKFKDKEIPQDLIEEIIEAGSYAPSAKNRQPWKCLVLGNSYKSDFLNAMQKGLDREEKINTTLPKSKCGLADAKNTLRIMHSAPIIIVIINTNGKSPFVQLDSDERFAEICDTLSIGAFIENMILQADLLGLGTLWIANTCFAYQELASHLDIQGQLVGAVALGYANEQPAKRQRKPFSDIVEFKI